MSESKKIVYVKYFPDDMLQGCALLTFQSELVYRRICDHIYTSGNRLFDDDITWQVLTAKFHTNDDVVERIKAELIRKNKIYIKDGLIGNKGCDKWLEEAKTFSEAKSNAGRKGAKARWDGTANRLPIATNSQQPTANSHQNNNIFEEFWNIIRFKKGKEDARKSFIKIDFSKEKHNHLELAEQYNQYLDNLPEWQTPKYVQGWLTGKRWNDEESLTPTDFAKKYHIEGTFIKFENDLYYFREKDSFGMVDYKYNKNGKIVSDGKKQKG